MLPTPSTSHVAFDRVYEPAEDSYLLLDTLSSPAEKAFLHERFGQTTSNNSPSPLVVEIGTGSGVIISFLNTHAGAIFGRHDIITLGVDVNRHACKASEETVNIAQEEQTTQGSPHGLYAGNLVGDLALPLKSEEVDVLVFNPPYVPSDELPGLPEAPEPATTTLEGDSHLLSLSYAGGVDGMEVTDRLLLNLQNILSRQRGCAYILLCAQNRPDDVKHRVRDWGSEWLAETVGTSGKTAGWEKLQIVRIWRTPT